MDDPVIISSRLRIPLSELVFQFSRSGGKGGQNVNKVETKVELIFDVRNSPSITVDDRSMLLHRLGSRLDGEGKLHIISQESRSQWANREQAVSKFVGILEAAMKPVKKRTKTRIPASSKRKRLEHKKRRGEIKKLRRMKEE
jgi:ribosome-associated protein